jgi:hypothetical protein
MKIKIGTNSDLTFSENEKQFLKLLEEDAVFEEFIKKIRRLVKLPENIEGEKSEVDEHTRQIVNSLAILLVDIFDNLSTHWYETFASIIMTGVAIPSEYKQTDAISYQFEDENPSDEPYRKALTITIHTYTTRNGIKKFLSDNKEEIDTLLKKLSKDHTIKMKDIDFKKEVSNLKKLTSENTYSKITDTLRDTYGDNLPEQFNEYDKLSIYNMRYKKDLQNILKKDPDHIKILEETLAQLKNTLQ